MAQSQPDDRPEASKVAFRGRSAASPGICLCTDSAEPSGVGEHMIALALGLRVCCRPLIACPASAGGSPLLDRARRLGVAAEPIDPDDLEDLTSSLRRFDADILHVHAGIGWEGHALVKAGRRAGAPRILRTEHLPYVLTDPAQRREYSEAVALVDQLICVSEAARKTYVAAGVAPEKIVTVRNGVRPRMRDTGVRSCTRALLGLSRAAPVVLTVARMTPQKGHATLLDAALIVRRRRLEAIFMLVGAGPLEEALRQQAHARGLGPSMLFLGARQDVPELLAAADVFVLPSHFEGLPLVVLEAMAAGLPVVATRIGGTEEAVADQETGLLVPPGDAPALASALLAVIEDPVRAQALGEAGRARFLAEFQADRMTAETLKVYRAVAPLTPDDAME